MAIRYAKSRTVPLAMFAYGCLASLLSLFALIRSFFDPQWPRDSLWRDEFLFLLLAAMFVHMTAFFATWVPYHYFFERFVPRYPPLIHPDRASVRFGRAAVITTALTSIFTWIPAVESSRGAAASSTGLTFIWWAFLAVAVFIAVVWALSPEYLFSQRLLKLLFTDTRYSPRRLESKRAAPPLEPWLTALFACCEQVASGPPGAIDCLSLQGEISVRLESRVCLIQHRKLLTHEGFREIRRFVQAVEALDCRSSNELARQNLVSSAQHVLEWRDRSAILRRYHH